MSEINFNCPECGKELTVIEEKMGHAVDCPACNTEIMLMQDHSSSFQSSFIRYQMGKAVDRQSNKSTIAVIILIILLFIIGFVLYHLLSAARG
jgi:DNA-directed RNA polymerase subunit RPC12/RpoP